MYEDPDRSVTVTSPSFSFEHNFPCTLPAFAKQAVPSFLMRDPDFAVPGSVTLLGESLHVHVQCHVPPEGEGDEESASVSGGLVGDARSPRSGATGRSGRYAASSLGTHSVSYQELPAKSRELDQVLYNVLKMNIKGSKT